MNYDTLFSDRAAAAKPSLIDELFKMLGKAPQVISLAAGAPDVSLLPVEVLEPLSRQAVEHYGRAVLQYGLTQGFLPLREAALPLLERHGVKTTAAGIHVATGGSGALNNVCMALLNKGDTVLAETVSYAPALKVFVSYEAKVEAVACDGDGMLPEALEKRLTQGGRVKFVYVLPTFQNPTGYCMPDRRRRELAEVAKKHGVLLVEDDVYYDLRYRGEAVPALHAYAPEQVVYLTSVSKILAPAMRVGLAVMPPALLEKVLILKQGIDMQTSSYTQALVTEFLHGDFEAHIAGLVTEYGKKLDIMVEALEAHMPKGFTWNRPDGGMFLWVTGPEGFDAGKLLDKAVEHGVAFVPGNSFYVDETRGRNTMRLSFANPPADQIAEGVRRLAEVCGAK